MRVSFGRLCLEQAWSSTWKSGEEHAGALVTAVTSAVMAAAMVAIKLAEGSWKKAAVAALASGVGALALFILITFCVNLVKAPRRVREQRALPALPANALAQLGISFAGTRPTDVMQFEASVLAEMIEVRLQRRPGTATLSPADADKILERIWYFGGRAKSDEMISAKSRKRSLALHREMLALAAAGEFGEIHQKCRDFVEKLKASF